MFRCGGLQQLADHRPERIQKAFHTVPGLVAQHFNASAHLWKNAAVRRPSVHNGKARQVTTDSRRSWSPWQRRRQGEQSRRE